MCAFALSLSSGRMSSWFSYNYAKQAGIQSAGAAITFAGLYFALASFYLMRLFKNPVYVSFVTTYMCISEFFIESSVST